MTPVSTLASGEYGTTYFNTATADYEASGLFLRTLSPLATLTDSSGHLGDWAGQITNLEGARVGLYDVNPLDPAHMDLGSLTTLSSTGQNGIAPNSANANPVVLSKATSDTYVFLLDPATGQLTSGREYLLQITVPAGSKVASRRILIVVGHTLGGEAASTPSGVTFTLTATDGRPVHMTGSAANGARVSETYLCPRNENGMALVNANISLFPTKEIQIGVSADRAVADPSDPIVYRALVTNTGLTHLHHIIIRSALPPSLRFVSGSARGQTESADTPIIAGVQGTTLTLTSKADLAPGHSLSVAYVVEVSAADTTVRNQLTVEAENFVARDGSTRSYPVHDGPAIADVRVNQGLLSEAGILIGRVFWDQNGDGCQQPQEPGIAGAVIILDNGDRLTTDKNGLFSAPNLSAGYHSAVLDLSSVPEYSPERDRHFIAGNGPSRTIRMETGGMARLSFPLKQRRTGVAKP